ncbi:ABC transporter ATP-binding protein [Candidatus Dojkabacteria bacterium]|nr:ABC transporter ATP-binding protein [Candidatus Dojkabacteria bacterium]
MSKENSSIKLVYKAVKEVISANKFEGILYPVLTNIRSLLDICKILVMGKLLDSITNFILNTKDHSLKSIISSEIGKIFIIIIFIEFVSTAITKFNEYFQQHLYDKFIQKYKVKCIKKFAQLNLQDVEQTKFQNLVQSRVPNYSLDTIWDTYLKVTDILYQSIRLVSSAIVIVTQMSIWGLVIALFVIPEAIFRFNENQKIKEYRDKNTEKRKFIDYLSRQATDIANFAELRVDNGFKFFHKSFERESSSFIREETKLNKEGQIVSFVWSWIGSSLRRLAQLALVPIAIIDKYSIGTFKYLFDYIDNLYGASWNVIWQILMLKNNTLYIKDYFDLMEYQGFGDVFSGSQQLNNMDTPKIEFKNVSFKYPNSSASAIEDISFIINPGEKVAVIGHDNSGKSTLSKLLCGLYQIGPGDIFIDDISIKNLERGELKEKLAMVFENYVKYTFSIRKNIVLTEPERLFNRRLYEEALEITGLDDWLKEYGMKDSQVLGKLFSNGMDISSGHWQRIAIARAIYHDRSVLIFDESLTQIDSFSRRPILEKTIKHRPKQTFINITQDESDSDLFDKIIYINKGKLDNILIKD